MSQKMQSKNDSDQEKLAGALDTIAEVLVRSDLESVRGRIDTLESSLTERIKSVKDDTGNAIDRVMNDLSSRIEGLVKKLDEAERSRETTLANVKKDVQGNLDRRAERLEKSLADLTAGLSAVQLEVQQQARANEQTSGLLNNMATVFQGRPAARPPALSGENLDNALDQMFESTGPEMDLEADSEPFTKK